MIWQVDVSKVDEQHPYGLFRCVQEPAETRDSQYASVAESIVTFAEKFI